MVVIIGGVVVGVVAAGASHPGPVLENCRRQQVNRRAQRRLPMLRLLRQGNALNHRATLEMRRFRRVPNAWSALNGQTGLSAPSALHARICQCAPSVRVLWLNLVRRRNPGLCSNACSV